MTEVDDGYDSYYAERLWQLLPALYRTADTDSFTAPGPLRELLNRIGPQVAVVRRSIDRLWANQSIETCDDWVIPYIGDLLGTDLAGNLDARAHRLDVAKTIYYRRRKGTLQILEDLALDVTGWTAHVVEGFRRLARTRHGLDPAIGPAAFPQASAADVAQLLQIEGLTGLLTGGPAGGFADLRSAHGATLADTAFDESFHAADVRAGRGAAGHFRIPELLVFLWRLTSFPVVAGTPVAVAGHEGQYVFDPTGRQIPLFLPPAPDLGDFSGARASVREWQVPGPLTNSLETAVTDSGTSPPPPVRPPYPDADVPACYALGGNWQLASIWPETGTFAATPASPAEPLTVDYQYGFSSTIGAGPYNRYLLGNPPAVVGTETPVTGGTGLDAALSAAGATGTVTIGDSRTYGTLADVGSTSEPIVSLLVRAGPSMRPVLRPSHAEQHRGSSPGAARRELVLDGLTISGCDIVLRGSFDTVRLTACTIDPGTTGPGSPPLVMAADGVPLAPGRIFVEADPAAPAGEGGTIRQLLIDHCIAGPVRTRFEGAVETLTITDSIIQGLPATTGPAITAADIFDPSLLATSLLSADPLSAALLAAMPERIAPALRAYRARPAGEAADRPPARGPGRAQRAR